jgi:tetratricopeptide (TPR) repeat protein
MRRSLAFLAAILFFVLPLSAWQDPLTQGDAAWSRRAQGEQGGRPQPGPIDEAIAAYDRALRADPANLDAAWKLLRALHFKGEYLARTPEEKQRIFARGRDVADAALDRIGQRVGGRKKLDDLAPPAAAKALAGIPQAKPIHLWAAVHWGLWGDNFGRLAAARQGVGDRVRRSAEILVALDERFEEGAGHRILGRLHTLAPKVPLITGWVDRDKAVAELRRAVTLGPDNFLNHLYLADALLQHQPGKKAEAQEILRRLLARQPSPERLVEDERAQADARKLLADSGRS